VVVSFSYSVFIVRNLTFVKFRAVIIHYIARRLECQAYEQVSFL